MIDRSMTEEISSERALRVALWGDNGHQIQRQLERYPRLRLVAYGACSEELSASLAASWPGAKRCRSYPEILKSPDLDLISLCSPRRADQAEQTVAALEAGISVYAEKPCALDEAELDRILEAESRSAAVFHEMAGTVCGQPYWDMRERVIRGEIGEVVQVLAQKSYPFHGGRPTEEAVDGGLIAQNGVHALRFVEHVTGLRINRIAACETGLGETRPNSDLKMAASLMGALSNGGAFAAIANYLLPEGFPSWGNETLRIFGTRGMLEAVDGGARTRLIVGAEDRGELGVASSPPDWLAAVIAHVADGTPMPFDLETELHPTRMTLRAKRELVFAEIQGKTRQMD